jgi:hypothetical protein
VEREEEVIWVRATVLVRFKVFFSPSALSWRSGNSATPQGLRHAEAA